MILKRFANRCWSLRGHASTGALILVGIIFAKFLADIPRLSEKVSADGWGGVEGVLGGLAILAALFAGAAIVGGLLGLLCGFFTPQPQEPEGSSLLQTTSKRLE
jgi:hypothetical protein